MTIGTQIAIVFAMLWATGSLSCIVRVLCEIRDEMRNGGGGNSG